MTICCTVSKGFTFKRASNSLEAGLRPSKARPSTRGGAAFYGDRRRNTYRTGHDAGRGETSYGPANNKNDRVWCCAADRRTDGKD